MALKAREVRERCQGRVDPQVLQCIEALAEQQSVIREQLLVVAQMYDRVIDMVASMVTVADNMKGALDQMQVRDPGDGDDGPTH